LSIVHAMGCGSAAPVAAGDSHARPAVAEEQQSPPVPRRYVCRRAATAPRIDGRIEDAPWASASWTEQFVDILGPGAARPRFATRAKMLWDDDYFYIAAEMEEPHVWATLTARDSVIYRDNDFEVFIDPDGDTHAYFEIELNALSTEWDLFLAKPYRDGGKAISDWDIAGLRSAVWVDGTINDPADTDRGWSVEIAIPWRALEQEAGRPVPPSSGDVWRVSFSRVEWRTEVVGDEYRKVIDHSTGKPLPEDNWVWSPQGVVNMHCPERWGLVLFAGPGEASWPIDLDQELSAREGLRLLYHAQRAERKRSDRYTDDLQSLLGHAGGTGSPGNGLSSFDSRRIGGFRWPPRIVCTDSSFEAVLSHEDGRTMHIDHEGRIWMSGPNGNDGSQAK
jgi:hypothetical protein